MGVIDYLRSIVANFDFVLLQETWLANFNCNRMYDISDDFVFFHNSSMESKRTAGIFSGRPFGGTAILVRKCLASRVSCIASSDPRITAVHFHNKGSQSHLVVCSAME